MSDKEHAIFKSRYNIGDPVDFYVVGKPIQAYVRSVMFTESTVYYSIYLKGNKTVIHHVASGLLEDPGVEE